MDSLPEKPKSVGQPDEAATPGPSFATAINPLEEPRITDPTVRQYVQSRPGTVSISPDLSKMGVQPLGDAITHPPVEIVQPNTSVLPAAGKRKPKEEYEKWREPFLKQAA